MSNPPRVHHYLPKFYTKRWNNPDGLVYRFSRHRSGVVDRLVTPARVGWSYDLYRMPGEEGPNAQRLEQSYFARLDGAAAVALNKMLSSPPKHLDETDTGAWAMFTMSLFHRSPSYLAEMKSFGLKKWREALSRLEQDYDRLRSVDDPPTYSEYAAARSDVEGENATMENLPHLLARPKIMDFLAAAPWVQFQVPPFERTLLLSDAPLVMTNGLDTPGGHLGMPLSPHRLLVIARDKQTALDLDRVPVRHLVKAMNTAVVERARHFVVSTDLTQAAFIRKHLGTQPIASLLGHDMPSTLPGT